MNEYRKPFEYMARGHVFRIYDADGKSTGDVYHNREEAKKRVYELNGWKYEPRNAAATAPAKG